MHGHSHIWYRFLKGLCEQGDRCLLSHITDRNKVRLSELCVCQFQSLIYVPTDASVHVFLEGNLLQGTLSLSSCEPWP